MCVCVFRRTLCAAGELLLCAVCMYVCVCVCVYVCVPCRIFLCKREGIDCGVEVCTTFI
jgi:hypothetical protein